MTSKEYLDRYASSLADNIREQGCLYQPENFQLAPLHRDLYDAQIDAAGACVAAWGRQKSVIMAGECGTGKTTVALAAVHSHANGRPYRCLIMCPPQLMDKWDREVGDVINDRDFLVTYRVDRPSFLNDHRLDGLRYGQEFYILSRERAKLPLRRHGEQVEGTSIARYIKKKMRGFFDYLILDECHEEAKEDSLQSNAAGQLISACRKVIALTGTLMNGHAESIRPLLFRLAPHLFLEEGIGWNDADKFHEKYGRTETVITETVRRVGKKTMKHRTKKTRQLPGLCPTFLPKLLAHTVFLDLKDVGPKLPELKEKFVGVSMGPALRHAYSNVVSLQLRIGNSGLLHEALRYPDFPYSQIPASLIHPEAGNKTYESVHEIYPKDQALIDILRKEINEGRQCWVFVQYTGEHDVANRLGGILSEHDIFPMTLRADLPPVKRESWIARYGSKYRVVISHPKLVETGLDLFSKDGSYNFCTLIFYETGCNLATLRQASRRSWRIGQRKECRVYYLYYKDTIQEDCVQLMGAKMKAALEVEGRLLVNEDVNDSVNIEKELIKRLKGGKR